MTRALQYANLAGVLVLGALCAFQWQRDRTLNLEVNRLEKTRIADEAKIQEQEKSLEGLTRDLALFKDQLITARAELGESREKLRKAESENLQLIAHRDQLRESITNWMTAVSIRDERIREASDRIRSLADELNASIRKFNELATNYNSVVADLNKLNEERAASSEKR